MINGGYSTTVTQTEWKTIFADNLAGILREKGMSQRELAEDSGISISMISEYVNGVKVPGLFFAINLAYALDMELDELFDFGERIESN